MTSGLGPRLVVVLLLPSTSARVCSLYPLLLLLKLHLLLLLLLLHYMVLMQFLMIKIQIIYKSQNCLLIL